MEVAKGDILRYVTKDYDGDAEWAVFMLAEQSDQWLDTWDVIVMDAVGFDIGYSRWCLDSEVLRFCEKIA